MTDLPFGEPLTRATPNVSTRKCVRHDWQESVRVGEEAAWTVAECRRCGKVRDEAATRRNRRNRQRGGSFERSVAKRLGGRRTGPLGGRDDVMVGSMFAIQTKRAQRFSLGEARTYLDDQRRTFPDRIPLVVHAFPGERGGVVVLSLDDWESLHGHDAMKGDAS